MDSLSKHEGGYCRWRYSAAGGSLQDFHRERFIIEIQGQLANSSTALQTEQDFAEIAGAGLNYVRIPIGYWAIEVRENEPFLAKTSWK
jgi:aryl-phospho-beta-D-glucosidase BglC (GH1 family)